MERNSRGRKLVQGSEFLQAIFEGGRSPLSEQFLRWKLWRKWPEYVGSTIAEVSEPASYRRGTLYIWVKNSIWMQQLVFMLDPIRDKINASLGFEYIKTIHLTLDRKYLPATTHAQELKDQLDKLTDDTK
jgi:hypothetical protein